MAIVAMNSTTIPLVRTGVITGNTSLDTREEIVYRFVQRKLAMKPLGAARALVMVYEARDGRFVGRNSFPRRGPQRRGYALGRLVGLSC